MANKIVSIIIVNWNGISFLPTCIESLKKQTYRDFEVVVVDNGSNDGSVILLKSDYPWVKLVVLPVNSGFSGGNNEGLKHANGEYIVVMNNDAEAEPDWLERLVAAADANPDAGQVACRICSMHDHDMIDSLGHGVCADGMTRGRYRLQRWSEVKGRFKAADEIFFGTACVSLYRRVAIDQVGFFDDDMFAFAEDSDLGMRLRWGGWRAVIATDAVVYHKYSGTGGAFSPFKLYLVERNHYWVAVKNFPFPMLLLVPFYSFVRYLVQLKVVLNGEGSGGEFAASDSKLPIVRAIVKGTWDALLGLPLMILKRRGIMKNARISSKEMQALMKKYRMSFYELLDVLKAGSGR
ncbi:MAG: glycosyltransferase family 2 protein [Geobacteraceae bacterium]|nr:glycosyltransferase family 2 protein [Geobacteraceae bacterium]